MKITGIKVWGGVDIRLVREMQYSFGAQATAEFEPGDLPDDPKVATNMAKVKAVELFEGVVFPALTEEVKCTAKVDKVLALALRVERPKVVRAMEVQVGP